MKTTDDLVLGWIRKADSDLDNAALCLSSGKSLDTACFHAQQAAEKLLKSYLMAYGLPAPLIHNIEKLVELCEQHDPKFVSVKPLRSALSPYAVQFRYDEDFWPSEQETATALQSAQALRNLLSHFFPK